MRNKSREDKVKSGRRRVRAGIISKLIIFTLIYLIIGLGYYTWFPTTLSNFLARFLSEKFISTVREYKIAIALILYVIGVIIICVRESTRYVRNLDLVLSELNSLTDYGREVASFPEELKDVEVAIKDARYNLMQNEKTAREADRQKNEMLAFLAHDLRTPLTSIIGYLQLLKDTPDLTPEQSARYVNITVDKAYRLEELLEQFFDITRMNLNTMTLNKSRVDLTMMLNQIADEFYPMFENKGLQAVLKVEPGLILEADADRLARVFDNILKNAVAYSFENSPIEIEAHSEEDRIRVTITNAAEDMPEDKLQMIFNKFYRGDSARSSQTGGAGLGLAITKEIVELHGGTITARSRNGKMSFIIILNKGEPGETPAAGTDQQ